MKTKKELKAEYRQHKPLMGVYQIKNTVNDRIFIEGSTDVHAKWNRHQTELRFGSHRNFQLQKDWNEFTSDKFEFEVLSELKHQEEVDVNYQAEVKLLEKMIIDDLNIQNDNRY